MKNLLPILFVALFHNISIANGDPIKPIVNQLVVFEVEDDYIMIEYMEGVELDERRQINIFNAKGKRVFKTKTLRREKITELNMHQMRPGKYIIETKVGNKIYRKKYTKY